MQGVFPQIRNVVKRPVSMAVVPEVPPDPQPVVIPSTAGTSLTSTPAVSDGNTADAGSHTGTQTESYAAAKRGKVTRLGAFQNVDWTDLGESKADDVTNYPPVRFRVNEHLFFVGGNAYEGGPQLCNEYHWIVQYAVVNDRGMSWGMQTEKRDIGGDDSDKAKVTEWVANRKGYPPYDGANPKENVHFLSPKRGETVKIGQYYLTKLLKDAEAADYQFALRMQGLQNSTLNAVWVCTDPDYVSEQRSSMMDLFMKQYVSRLYGKRGTIIEGSQPSPEEVIKEAINLHEKFCVNWIRHNKKNLAPVIQSAAEAFITIFMGSTLQRYSKQSFWTCKYLARILWRDPVMSPHFSLCLHYYMVKMDQDRGGRNANYKSMFNSSSANMMAINSMGAFLAENMSKIRGITDRIDGLAEHEKRLSKEIVDWYDIASQIPLAPEQYPYRHPPPPAPSASVVRGGGGGGGTGNSNGNVGQNGPVGDMNASHYF